MSERDFTVDSLSDMSLIKQTIIDTIIDSPNIPDINIILRTMEADENILNLLSAIGIPVRKGHNSIQIEFSGQTGLQFAKYMATSYYNKHTRSPRTKDLPQIHTAIYSKLWEKYDIRTWNDFLRYSDLPLNRGDKWVGQKGLEHAVNLFHDCHTKLGKIPTVTELKNVFARINEGTWIEQGIYSWSDFVTFAMTQRWNLQDAFML